MSNDRVESAERIVPVFEPQWPAPSNVQAAITLVAPDATEFGAYNLAQHVGDDPVRVSANRAQLARQLDVPHWQWLEQVHGVEVLRADVGTSLQPVPQADACTTQYAKLACAVLTADCLPVLLCNQQGTQVAAVHAGWRGLAAGLLEKACKRFAAADTLMAYLGPAIGASAFEVGPEVKVAFESAMGRIAGQCFVANPLRPTHYFADLYALARLQLAGLGVASVSGGNDCTYTDARFYSYRRQPITGRFASVIWLTD